MTNNTNKPVHAIKFKNWCIDNDVSAKKLSKVLHLSVKAIYTFWSGDNQVSDHYKKVLEKELKMPIYDIFYNENFDTVAEIHYKRKE